MQPSNLKADHSLPTLNLLDPFWDNEIVTYINHSNGRSCARFVYVQMVSKTFMTISYKLKYHSIAVLICVKKLLTFNRFQNGAGYQLKPYF